MSKIIAIASDHAGPAYKKAIIEHLTALGYTCINLGTDTEESVDYPVYADKLCKAVTSGEAELGILVCGTGIGMSIAANKHKGIRAALCGDPVSAALTRQHNNANVLCMGARIIGLETAFAITDAFVGSEFLGGRHQRRVDMLESL
ncbi:MAG: ribose 5-phosphate isomerase B [Clostridia bacterium]|nr:ribose 5-phosphate isomerase B [Clostridia bacterium]